MKAAVIDLGTNTFHLIIANLLNNRIEVLYKTNVPVQLGQGKINDHIIIPEAFERGIHTLKNFRREIDKHQVDVVKAIATSAIRSAANGADFVDAADKEANIEIEVASGDEEAIYIFKGVKATGIITDTSLIMDIGGGSTEFILCNAEKILWKKSYNIGAARLMQAYFQSDPLSIIDQTNIVSKLDETLADLKTACTLHRPQQLIGSAGAFETYASMLDEKIDIKSIKTTPIDLNKYHELAARLIASTHAERELMPGLIKLRVDMIVMAAMLTNYVIDHCALKKLSLSTYDLKMGALYQLANSKA